MNVGFTGTRLGMTEAQAKTVDSLLREFRADIFEPWFLHGNCIGADDQANRLAQTLGYKTRAYPASGLDDYQISVFASDEAMNYTTPLARNRRIVKNCDVLIACPKEQEEPKSARGQGTWSTIRHARKPSIHRKTYIVWPDGSCTMPVTLKDFPHEHSNRR